MVTPASHVAGIRYDALNHEREAHERPPAPIVEAAHALGVHDEQRASKAVAKRRGAVCRPQDTQGTRQPLGTRSTQCWQIIAECEGSAALAAAYRQSRAACSHTLADATRAGQHVPLHDERGPSADTAAWIVRGPRPTSFLRRQVTLYLQKNLKSCLWKVCKGVKPPSRERPAGSGSVYPTWALLTGGLGKAMI